MHGCVCQARSADCENPNGFEEASRSQWRLENSFITAGYWADGEIRQRIALFLGWSALDENIEDLSVHVSD